MTSLRDFFSATESDGLLVFWGKELLVALLVLVLFWLLARLARYLLITWGPRLTAWTVTDLDDRILARITPPVSLLIISAGVYFAIRSLPLPDKVQLGASGAVFVVSVAILTNIAYRAADEVLQWYAGRLADADRDGLNRQLIPLFEKLVTIFLVGTALIIILKHFNYDILSLVTALGIGSLAIGMAAKDTLANMISGFTIMIDRPFRIGDRIQLSKEQWGDVLDIGLRSTKIKTPDHTLLIIPNATLCNSNVVNLAFPEVRTKGQVKLQVAYGSDLERVKQVLVEITAAQPDVLPTPAPEALLLSFGDSGLNLGLFFWVGSYTDLLAVSDRIQCAILARFNELGIDIPYPTTHVLLQKD